MYGVGEQVDERYLLEVQKDILKLKRMVFSLKLQFNHLFPDSKEHLITDQEREQFTV
jgi:hypothetical protein